MVICSLPSLQWDGGEDWGNIVELWVEMKSFTKIEKMMTIMSSVYIYMNVYNK